MYDSSLCLDYNHCCNDKSFNFHSKNDVCASLGYGAGSTHTSQNLTCGYEFCRQRSHRVRLNQGMSSKIQCFFHHASSSLQKWSDHPFNQPWSWIRYHGLSEDFMLSRRCTHPVSEFLNWSQPWLPRDPEWPLPQQSNDGPVQRPWPACIAAEHHTWNPHPFL